MDITQSANINKKYDLNVENLYIDNKNKLFKNLKTLLKHLLLLSISFITFFPFIWMAFSALKSKEEIFEFPPKLIPKVMNWNNFIEVFKEAPFDLYIRNSLVTSVSIVIFQVVSCAMIAYALTQFEFRGKKILFAIIMCTYMLPSAATYVPCYMILSKMNLIDTLTGLVISNLGNVFGIFLLRQSFLQINKSLIDAARIDGAGELKILWKVVFPLTKPTFITFALISFVTYYNDYMYPSLIIKTPEKFLISAGLRQFFIEGGAYGIKWPQVMAASTITVIPLLILFLIAQKWFMKGVSDNGVKE